MLFCFVPSNNDKDSRHIRAIVIGQGVPFSTVLTEYGDEIVVSTEDMVDAQVWQHGDEVRRPSFTPDDFPDNWDEVVGKTRFLLLSDVSAGLSKGTVMYR